MTDTERDNSEDHGVWEVIEGEPSVFDRNYPAYVDLPPADETLFHVVPVNDLFPHVLGGLECWCHPQLNDEEPSVVIHNSADGRELYETGQRLLS